MRCLLSLYEAVLHQYVYGGVVDLLQVVCHVVPSRVSGEGCEVAVDAHCHRHQRGVAEPQRALRRESVKQL